MNKTPIVWERIGIAIVLLHALVAVVHSAAHFGLNIFMSTWQNAYIFVVIIALPLIAGLQLARHARTGFLLLFLSMLGSLLFGGYYHFIAPGPDNVASLPHHSWALPFQVSAVVLAITELAGVVVGLMRPQR